MPYVIVYQTEHYASDQWSRYAASDSGQTAAEQMKEAQKQYPSCWKWKIRKVRDDGLPDDWREREAERFSRGDYEPVPWAACEWYQPKHNEHFCHLSLKQVGKIAYTESPQKGEADRQTIISPGRYLKKHFGDELTADEIEGWAAEVSVAAGEFQMKITQDADEIERVYEHGPRSCMAGPASDFNGHCHPARVYAGPDLAVAYLGSADDATARAVVWPEKKIYNRVYGDTSRLEKMLREEGYKLGGFVGARIQRIECGEGFVMPYVDGISYADDQGEYIVLGDGDLDTERTDGVTNECGRYSCDRCGRRLDEDETYTVDDETWCESCVDDDAFYDEITEEYTRDRGDCVEVHCVRLYYRSGDPECSHAERVTSESTVDNRDAYVFDNDRGEWWEVEIRAALIAITEFAQAPEFGPQEMLPLPKPKRRRAAKAAPEFTAKNVPLVMVA